MTAADLATYLRMLLGRGAVDGVRILSDEGYARLTQRLIPTDEPPQHARYGYGVETTIVDGRTRIGHGGGMVGYFAGMVGDVETGVGVVALVNGPGAPDLIARTAFGFALAAMDGTPFAFPDLEDATAVADAAAFVGNWVAVEGHDVPARLRIAADGAALLVAAEEATAPLHPYDRDVVVTAAPPLARFPLRFHRGDDEQARRATYGDTLYAVAGQLAPPPVPHSAEWGGLPGHYRSHHPWTPSIRVSLREGRLWLFLPSEPDGLAAEQPLVPLADGEFRAGDDPRIPERIRFDVPIDGRTHRAALSGRDYFRVSTP